MRRVLPSVLVLLREIKDKTALSFVFLMYPVNIFTRSMFAV